MFYVGFDLGKEFCVLGLEEVLGLAHHLEPVADGDLPTLLLGVVGGIYLRSSAFPSCFPGFLMGEAFPALPRSSGRRKAD